MTNTAHNPDEWPNQNPVIEGIVFSDEVSQEANIVDEDDETDLDDEMED